MSKKEIRQDYKNKKKLLKEEYKKKIDEYYKNIDKKEVINPPKRSVLEEIGNAVTHGIGSIFAIIAFILMLKKSNTDMEYFATIVYSFGLLVMFTMSCLYHSFRHGSSVKRLFRRFDYSSIYLLIGATFAPILLCYSKDLFGLIFFFIQWLVIAVGITFVGIFGPTKLRAMHMALYMVIGWSGLLFIPRMLTDNINLFYYILGGGIVYSIGIIPFALKKKCSHFIWHFFVLAGAIVQWIGIYLYIY